MHAPWAAFCCVPASQAVGSEVVERLIHPVGIVLHAVLPATVYCFDPIEQVVAADTVLLGVGHALPKIELDRVKTYLPGK